MNPQQEYLLSESRRQFLGRGVNAVGWAALASLLGNGRTSAAAMSADGPLPGLAHFAPKAKHVIYLHMVGGPSQLDLYDYKPKMLEMYDKDLPDSIRNGQRTDHDDLRPEAVSRSRRANTSSRNTARAGCG